MPMSFQLLDVLTPLSDCRQESAERWNGDFGGFVYVLDGFPQRDFVLWVYMCSINFSLSFPATTPRATTPHPYHHGLPRLCIHPGYHAIVLSSILWLSHQSYHAQPHTHVHRVITPAIVVRILYFSFHRLLRHLFFTTYTTTRYNLLHNGLGALSGTGSEPIPGELFLLGFFRNIL